MPWKWLSEDRPWMVSACGQRIVLMSKSTGKRVYYSFRCINAGLSTYEFDVPATSNKKAYTMRFFWFL